jgi:mannitol/fructose-specific phosphotransferase system IIA component (Ntr-type)
MNDGGPIRLSEFLRPETVVARLESVRRDEAIAELVRALASAGEVEPSRVDELTARVVENEKRTPSGLKRGLALPNCAAPGLARTSCALGISPAGVDFRCVDGQAATAVLLVVSPESTYERVCQDLEAVADLFEETRLAEDLAGLRAPEEVCEAIERAEEDELC